MEQSKYLSEDTIHALATPTGGALSIVRISGPHSLATLRTLASLGTSDEIEPRRVFRASLRFGEKKLDDAVAVFYRGPKSHTGEDLVEFFLHGGAVVAEGVLEALEQIGSRQALPGEFSFRAVRNGKMSVVEAQAVADLIAARNAGAAALALEKMEGSQARLVRDLAEELRKLSTMGELGIDFADQDVEELSLPVLKKRVEAISIRLAALEASFDRGQKIQDGVRVAFVGRPNAGKSSFFNALLGEERSIVSEVAGTTRDVVRETLTLRSERGTVTLRLEDTAGIRRTTEDRIEREGIERSVRAARDADFVVFIADAGANAAEWKESQTVWEEISTPKERTVAILTKADRCTPAALASEKARLTALGIGFIYTVSSLRQEGVHEASRGIVQFCERFTRRDPGEVLLTRLDHLRSVKDTRVHLERALSATEEDLFAADLRHALVALGPVIGDTLPDEILGRIFSEFCIGK
jgi:tRNA modification GTPase